MTELESVVKASKIALIRTGLALERAETSKTSVDATGYQLSAKAAEQLLTILLNTSPGFEAIIRTSTALQEVLDNLLLSKDILDNQFPVLTRIIEKAKSGNIAFPEASEAIKKFLRLQFFPPF